MPIGWYSRGYLPHFDSGSIAQAVSFRLAGSLPAELIANWRKQAAIVQPDNQAVWLHRLAEAELDRCRHAALSDPAFAAAVGGALVYFHPRRYTLHAWVVMPNHVHVLLTPAPGHSLAAIVHSWKSFTAKHPAAPRPCWQREYFDRFIRDARHFAAQVRYIERNPVKAGLCARPENWPWSSASARAPGECRQDNGAPRRSCAGAEGGNAGRMPALPGANQSGGSPGGEPRELRWRGGWECRQDAGAPGAGAPGRELRRRGGWECRQDAGAPRGEPIWRQPGRRA